MNVIYMCINMYMYIYNICIYSGVERVLFGNHKYFCFQEILIETFDLLCDYPELQSPKDPSHVANL